MLQYNTKEANLGHRNVSADRLHLVQRESFFASSTGLSNSATIVRGKKRRQIDELTGGDVAQALNTLSDDTYVPELDHFLYHILNGSPLPF